MGLNFGNQPIYGLNTVQTQIVGDFTGLSTINGETASQYEICVLVNQIVEALINKSAINKNFLETLNPNCATAANISNSLNKILTFLKSQ